MASLIVVIGLVLGALVSMMLQRFRSRRVEIAA